MTTHVLILCTHNSARSVLAEGMLNHWAAMQGRDVGFSAGMGNRSRCTGGYPDPSNAEGRDEAKRRAFELTRQAIGYRMLQLLNVPIESMDRAALQAAVAEIGRS